MHPQNNTASDPCQAPTDEDKFQAERTTRGFTYVPNVILEIPDITTTEKFVFLCVYRYAHDGCQFIPSQDTIARQLGLSTSQVRRALSRLKKEGWLKWQKGTTHQPNRYTVPTFVLPPDRASTRSLECASMHYINNDDDVPSFSPEDVAEEMGKRSSSSSYRGSDCASTRSLDRASTRTLESPNDSLSPEERVVLDRLLGLGFYDALAFLREHGLRTVAFCFQALDESDEEEVKNPGGFVRIQAGIAANGGQPRPLKFKARADPNAGKTDFTGIGQRYLESQEEPAP